jgi:hypothetical protein
MTNTVQNHTVTVDKAALDAIATADAYKRFASKWDAKTNGPMPSPLCCYLAAHANGGRDLTADTMALAMTLRTADGKDFTGGSTAAQRNTATNGPRNNVGALGDLRRGLSVGGTWPADGKVLVHPKTGYRLHVYGGPGGYCRVVVTGGPDASFAKPVKVAKAKTPKIAKAVTTPAK